MKNAPGKSVIFFCKIGFLVTLQIVIVFGEIIVYKIRWSRTSRLIFRAIFRKKICSLNPSCGEKVNVFNFSGEIDLLKKYFFKNKRKFEGRNITENLMM